MPRRHVPAPSTGELFDEMLVVLAQQGDRRAIERLFHRWNAKLLRAARRYCGNDEVAHDIAQECWLGICKGLNRLRDPARFRSFAFAVLHRRGADHLRKMIRERKNLAEQNEQVPISAPASQADSLAINQAFAGLPAEQRLAAHLHFVEGLTLKEIAEVQGIPDGTAKSRLFHARRALKTALTPIDEGETQ